jgi:lysine 6-dehydrogenase
MRVVALGGGGATGAVAARTAAGLATVTEVIIADRHLPSAEHVRDSLIEQGTQAAVTALAVDVTDDGGLRALLADVDAVINTVGPFLTFGRSTLQAAIDTGTVYLDICDDPEPTSELLSLHETAERAGVTAVVGIGASPGLSNLLAVLAASRVDKVEDLYTAWGVDVGDDDPDEVSLVGADGLPSAAALHWMHQISGTVAVVSAGTMTRSKPLQPVSLRLPGGLKGAAYVVGHPEPVTFHGSLRPRGDSACLMVINSGTVAYLDVIRERIDAGTLSIDEAVAALDRPTISGLIRSAMRSGRFPSPGTLPPFFAALTGQRRGQRISVLATTGVSSQGMATATGVPLALGLAQVLDGRAHRPGVHPCEAVIDATRLFAEFDTLVGGSGALLPVITEEVVD